MLKAWSLKHESLSLGYNCVTVVLANAAFLQDYLLHIQYFQEMAIAASSSSFCFVFCASPFFLTCSFLLWQQHAPNAVMEGLRMYNFRLDQLMSRQQYSIHAWRRIVEVLGERTNQDILIETSCNYISTLLFSNKVLPKSDLVWIDWLCLWVMENWLQVLILILYHFFEFLLLHPNTQFLRLTPL